MGRCGGTLRFDKLCPRQSLDAKPIGGAPRKGGSGEGSAGTELLSSPPLPGEATSLPQPNSDTASDAAADAASDAEKTDAQGTSPKSVYLVAANPMPGGNQGTLVSQRPDSGNTLPLRSA